MARRMREALTPVSAAGVAVGVVLFGAGFVAGRPDVALIGIVLFIAVAVAVRPRRAQDELIEVILTELPRGVGDDTATIARVRVTATAPGAELVLVSATALEFDERRIALTGPAASCVVRIPVVHSGVQELVMTRVRAAGADAVWIGDTTEPLRLRARIQPHARPLPFLPLPPVLGGFTGTHDAARAGEGGEFRDIHPFAPGDRLRRIDWKATARLGRRPGDLFVRRTMATADADVAIVVDDGEDVVGMMGDWSRGERSLGVPSSLDLAREAAWSLAAAYLGSADLVSFQVLSRAREAVPRGSGARQRERLRSAIAAVAPQPPRLRYTRTPHVAAGALVVLLSTFLDDEPVRLVSLWRAAGHRVLAVDTLPRLRTERLRREELAAARIVRAERDDRLHDVRGVGADLLVWDAPEAERTATLRALSRTRRR